MTIEPRVSAQDFIDTNQRGEWTSGIGYKEKQSTRTRHRSSPVNDAADTFKYPRRVPLLPGKHSSFSFMS